MSLNVIDLILNDNKVAEIIKRGDKFSYRVSKTVSTTNVAFPRYSSLREANLECLKWLKQNTSVDVFKLKSRVAVQKPQQSLAEKHRSNIQKINPIKLTIGGPNAISNYVKNASSLR